MQRCDGWRESVRALRRTMTRTMTSRCTQPMVAIVRDPPPRPTQTRARTFHTAADVRRRRCRRDPRNKGDAIRVTEIGTRVSRRRARRGRRRAAHGQLLAVDLDAAHAMGIPLRVDSDARGERGREWRCARVRRTATFHRTPPGRPRQHPPSRPWRGACSHFRPIPR